MIHGLRTAFFGAIVAAFAGMPFAAMADDTLKAYAAMAKLEANKAEAAGAVMLSAIPDLSDERRAEAQEDYTSDLEQIAGYIEALKAMDLAEGPAAAVEEFARKWQAASEAGADLLTRVEDTPEYHEEVFTWWESLDGLDDLVDDQLEAILEANGVAFE